MAEPTTYREPSRRHRASSIEPPRAEAPRHVIALASLAGLAGVGALVVGQIELLAICGAGAAAVAAHLVRAASAHRHVRALVAFLEHEDVIEGLGTWTSIDGHRRVRTVAEDGVARWERLDPSTGETLASYRAPAALAPAAVRETDVLERRAAHVHGRARRTRCFSGLPEEVRPGGLRVPVEADCVVLVVRRDAVLLERRDADGQLLGDTLHAHARAAVQAAEAEYGEALGEWSDASRGLPAPTRRCARGGWDLAVESRVAL